MIPEHSMVAWIAFGASLLFLVGIELGVVSRVRHLTIRQSAWWTATVIGVAAIFGTVLLIAEGRASAVQFATGYVVEFSLSVDNLLVFIMVLHYFAVPTDLQPVALKWGILGAIAMRAVMILGGTLILNELAWVIYVLGALLILTGLRMLRQPDAADVKIESNPLLRMVRKVMPVSEQFAGPAFFVRQSGRLVATPLLLVVLAIEWTDLMFATDSIPAIFAITRDPFLVYTSNILAIVGLRALFFVLAASIAQFVYLRFGVAAVLVLVGAKMLLAHFVVVPAGWSLMAIVVVLGTSIGASIWRAKNDEHPARLHG